MGPALQGQRKPQSIQAHQRSSMVLSHREGSGDGTEEGTTSEHSPSSSLQIGGLPPPTNPTDHSPGPQPEQRCQWSPSASDTWVKIP